MIEYGGRFRGSRMAVKYRTCTSRFMVETSKRYIVVVYKSRSQVGKSDMTRERG